MLGVGSSYAKRWRARASADSSSPASRIPSAPPCSASCRLWIAMANSLLIQMGSSMTLLRQFPQDVPILAHHLLGHVHLPREFCVEGRDGDSIRCFQHVQFVATLDAELFEEFFGQNHARGVSNCDEL